MTIVNMIRIFLPIVGGFFCIVAPWVSKSLSHQPRLKIGWTLAGCFVLTNGVCKLLIAFASIDLPQSTLALLDYVGFVFGNIALGNLLILLLFTGFRKQERQLGTSKLPSAAPPKPGDPGEMMVDTAE